MSELRPEEVDVLLLAAGYGKRLRPLTDNLPKPLVQVGGRPLIDWNLELIAAAGFRRVFINLFYLGEQIRAYVGDGRRYGLEVKFVPEPELLDTGGTVRNVFPLTRSPYLVSVNSDILIGRDFSYNSLLAAHAAAEPKGVCATLALRSDDNAQQYGIIESDAEGRVVGLLDARLPPSAVARSTAVTPYMYMGIQILNSRAIDVMPAVGSVFSLTKDTFRTLILRGSYLNSIVFPGYFSDIGTPERLAAASNDVGQF
ncbi:MAG: sugar phosphate nucleotidyltransferase [Bdellovibrionota bacterium]